jgi:hypothetical protein
MVVRKHFISLVNSQINFTNGDGQVPAHRDRRKNTFQNLNFQNHAA